MENSSMARHSQGRDDSESNYCGKIDRMLRELELKEDRNDGPNEALAPMDIDGRLEVNIGCEMGCTDVIPAFEPMDMDQETDVCAGDAQPGQTQNCISTLCRMYNN